jgi:hypothetical protein
MIPARTHTNRKPGIAFVEAYNPAATGRYSWRRTGSDPAKDVSGDEYQVTGQQDHETAVDMRNPNMRVMNDHGDDRHDNGDNERNDLRR